MKALGRSASRDHRCAPRACGACGAGGRPRRPRPFWVRQDVGWVTERREWLNGVSLRPAPLAAAALRVARDRPFRAGRRAVLVGATSCRGAREGASESAQMRLSVVVVGKPRCWSIAESARERLRDLVW